MRGLSSVDAFRGATGSTGHTNVKRSHTMKRFELLLAGTLAAVLLPPSLARAEVPYTCGTRTLRDVEAVIETFPAEKHTRVVTKTNRRGEREVHADTSSGERREKTYTVTVELEDMSYTAQ